MYAEEIIDHYKHPRNRGILKDADYTGKAGNAICGDMIVFYVNTENGVISDIKFEGEGCAISIASASILSEMAKGKTTSQILEMDEKEFFKKLGNIKTRAKCALVSLNALKKALGKNIKC